MEMLGVVGIKVGNKRKFYFQHTVQSAHWRRFHELSDSDTTCCPSGAPESVLLVIPRMIQVGKGSKIKVQPLADAQQP